MRFIDTNVFVYAIDDRDAVKQARAREIVLNACSCGGSLISAQVLNEFSCIAFRKFHRTVGEIRAFVRMFQRIGVTDVSRSWTLRALDIAEEYSLQFYDSLLLAAAEASGCTEFISEDLNDGQIYCGMKAVNPFI